jgi:hypothetical protein
MPAPTDAAHALDRGALADCEVDGAPIEWVDGRSQILPDAGTPPRCVVRGQAFCWDYLTDPNGTEVALVGIMGSTGCTRRAYAVRAILRTRARSRR